MANISPTLQSVLRTFTSSAEPVRLLNSMIEKQIGCPLTAWTSSLHMKHRCCSLVVGVKQTASQNVVRVCHKV
jgi:hypothetical protein